MKNFKIRGIIFPMRFKMKKETTDKNFSNFAIKIIAKYGVFTIIR